MGIRRIFWSLADCFRRADGRVAWATVVAFVAINAVVFSNAWRHDPRIGYDADGHRAYTKALAAGHLPTPSETHEFFSPPLPYVPASIARWYLDESPQAPRWRADWALKVGQLVQATASVPLTLAVLFIVRQLRGRRRDAFASFAALLCLGMLPVYYRSFAMFRGEPFLATFATLGIALTLRAFAGERRPGIVVAALAGVALGLACLSRQWAFFLLPPLAALGAWRLFVDPAGRAATLRAGAATMLAAAIVGGPFYIHLWRSYGSVKTFNRPEHADVARVDPDTTDSDEAAALTDRPEPPVPLASALQQMLVRPTRDWLAGHRVLLVYADTWGDYWQYFVLNATDKKGNNIGASKLDGAARAGLKNNIAPMSRFLGRVMVVSVVPTLALAAGAVAALAAVRRARRDPRAAALVALGLSIVVSIAGYAWFVASYPGARADTVKATYLLQIFPLLAIVTAAWLADLRSRRPRVAAGIVVALIVALLHNAPACVTHAVRILTRS